jgi:type III secretory pathway component EscU
MNLLFWALTIGVIGKVMLAVGVLIAHSELAHEKRVDAKVLASFRLEHTLTVVGIILIIAGYFMEVYFYDFIQMLTCQGSDCMAAVSAAMGE